MDLQHRTVVKQFLFASAGVLFIPSFLQEEGKPSIVLENIAFNNSDEKLLASFCECLLPTTNIPGAREIAAHFFVMKMLDDCTSKADQQKVLRGLRHLNKMAEKKFHKNFISCSAAERVAILAILEVRKQIPGDVAACYEAVKKYTLQAFASSQLYLGHVLVYDQVTGPAPVFVPIAGIAAV